MVFMEEKHITTFIFDCFGVVYNQVVEGWYKDYISKHGHVDENFYKILREYDIGNLSEEGLVEYFLKYRDVNSTKEEIREEIDNHLKLNLGLVDLIKKLKQKGFKIALLSNSNGAFFVRKIYTTYPEFKSLFDEIVISSEVRMAKPDPDIYFYALKKINSKPEESVFIDDNNINVEEAIKLGMQGHIFTSNSEFSDYVAELGIDLNN